MYKNLNILRAIAIIAIIFGHGCLQLGYDPMARWCGYLFVQIFFLLSAFLLGLKTGDKPLQWSFIQKRWWRMSKVYYPFLLGSVVVLLCLGKPVAWQSLAAHLAYLNYPLHSDLAGVGFGHLWYLSMLMLCYVLVQVLCSQPLFELTQKLLAQRNSVIAISLLTFCTGYVCTLVGNPCRIPFVLCSFTLLFVNAKQIMAWAEKASTWIAVAWLVVSNILCLVLFFYFDLNAKLLLRDTIVLLTAGSWLWFFISALRAPKCPIVLGWVSALSYELYLVHSPFVVGEQAMLSYRPISWFVTSVVVFGLAFALHKLTQRT